MDRPMRIAFVSEHANPLAVFGGCNGYLDHPFKNKPFETEKEILSLLANTGGPVYNQTSFTAYSCLNNETFT
jgi:hypothetical protein